MHHSSRRVIYYSCNMINQVLVLVLGASIANAAYVASPPAYAAYQPLYETVPKYDFDYGVLERSDGPNFGASETREGEETTGSYFVDLPDGRRQKVSYQVTAEGGFQADVSYEPLYKPVYKEVSYKPVYKEHAYKPTYKTVVAKEPVYKKVTYPAVVYRAPKTVTVENDHDGELSSYKIEEEGGRSFQRVSLNSSGLKKVYKPLVVKSYKPKYVLGYQPTVQVPVKVGYTKAVHPHFSIVKRAY